MMTREEILRTAERVVCGQDKEHQYGSPEDNFGVIAQLWTTYTGHLVTAQDVAVMMILFKVGRLSTGAGSDDTWVDIAGYSACGGECG